MTASSVDEVVELFERWGGDPYDEEVTQLAHALQTAALAREAGAEDPVVGAALLHDVGHLLELRAAGPGEAPPTDDRRHEVSGARWLSSLFPDRVTIPIVLHVRAKRYLCAIDPVYVDGLSAGSVRSLERQGGPLTPAEATGFEAVAGHRDAVTLRRWDDAGKVDGLEVPALDCYHELLVRLAGTST